MGKFVDKMESRQVLCPVIGASPLNFMIDKNG